MVIHTTHWCQCTKVFFYYIHLTECMFTTKKNKSIFVSNSRQSKAYKTLKIVDFWKQLSIWLDIIDFYLNKSLTLSRQTKNYWYTKTGSMHIKLGFIWLIRINRICLVYILVSNFDFNISIIQGGFFFLSIKICILNMQYLTNLNNSGMHISQIRIERILFLYIIASGYK